MSRRGNFWSRFLMGSSGRRWKVTAVAPRCFIVVIRKSLVPLGHPIPSMSRQGQFLLSFSDGSIGRSLKVTAAAPAVQCCN
ncbi:hypothetical protein CEXT_539141 [Caerostris extrusa]|uniref:Secreted protein n=1 Tax=Caerostris extrusa TaxID=172846 RepID=A0AAV4WND7_CAEEX|nr:hypothetical protein CEXT_539141 [Caerostris extrusa]